MYKPWSEVTTIERGQHRLEVETPEIFGDKKILGKLAAGFVRRGQASAAAPLGNNFNLMSPRHLAAVERKLAEERKEPGFTDAERLVELDMERKRVRHRDSLIMARFALQRGIAIPRFVSTEPGVAVDVNEETIKGMSNYLHPVGNNEIADIAHITQVGYGVRCYPADCPVGLLYDPVKHNATLVHATWRVLARGQFSIAVEGMVERGTDPANILAYIGPSAQRDSYELRDDEAAIFGHDITNDRDLVVGLPHAESEPAKVNVSLPDIAARQLEVAGVRADNIQIDPRDTVHEAKKLGGVAYSFRAYNHGTGPDGAHGIFIGRRMST